MTHPFYPPTTLPEDVLAYDQSLKDHKQEYGDVPMSSPADLAAVVSQAQALKPLAKQIQDMELSLAVLHERYNQQAAPLWKQFSGKIKLAKTFAETNDKVALGNFLKLFNHHVVRHDAAQAAAQPTPPKA